jgi:hypothetical protein
VERKEKLIGFTEIRQRVRRKYFTQSSLRRNPCIPRSCLSFCETKSLSAFFSRNARKENTRQVRKDYSAIIRVIRVLRVPVFHFAKQNLYPHFSRNACKENTRQVRKD